MTIRFVVDERSIDLNGLSSHEGCERIETLLDLIDDARSNGDDACYDDELFLMEVVAQRTFWQLFDPDSPVHLPPELSERAAVAFGPMARWYEVQQTLEPDSFDISIEGGPVETTASVAWAYKQAELGGLKSAACLCVSGRRRNGMTEVSVDGISRHVWFIQSMSDMDGYFRWLISENANHPDDIAEFASRAFRQLNFVDNCFDGISNMSKSCRQIVPNIVHHLSVLSDEGPRIFSGSWARVSQEFGTFGIDISDENGGTKQNSDAKKERRRRFGGDELYFWWHTKIERHQDRIHIYPNNVKATGKIIVGIFCKHLTT